MYAFTDIGMRCNILVYTRVYIYMYIYTDTRTYIYIYTYMYTYIHRQTATIRRQDKRFRRQAKCFRRQGSTPGRARTWRVRRGKNSGCDFLKPTVRKRRRAGQAFSTSGQAFSTSGQDVKARLLFFKLCQNVTKRD